MNALALASQTESKDIKLTGKKTLDSKSGEEENLFENIITELVISEKDGKDKSFLLSKLLNLSSDTENKEKVLSDFSKGNLFADPQSEYVSIQDLLQIAVIIKDGKDPATFPTDSKSLKIALSKPEVTEQLKGAKNIKELLDIAKKNNIEVKNFQFFQEEAALDPKDKKIIQKLKSEDIFKLIEKQSNSKHIQTISPINNTKDFIQNEKSNTNILQTILASKEINNTTKPEIKTSKIEIDKGEKSLVSSDNKKMLKEPKIVEEKVIIKDSTVIKEKTIVKDSVVVTEKVIILNNTDVKKNSSNKDIKSHKDTKEIVEQKMEKIDKQELTNQTHTKNNFENKIKTLSAIELNNNAQLDSTKIKPMIEKADFSTELDRESSDKTIVSTENKTTAVDKTKNEPEIKKTFNTFAQEFKEKVENYKPPLMKIKMELKPAGMGEVDVTLLTRGNNLQVNINSNANTIAIFAQNQAEFKASLVNMGFSDLQMNFSEQQKKEQDNQKQNNKNSFQQFDEEENEQDGFEMIIPQYV